MSKNRFQAVTDVTMAASAAAIVLGPGLAGVAAVVGGAAVAIADYMTDDK